MIEVKGLNKTFGDKKVLEDISIFFERGKTNLIIGESGSGKTVLIKCMVGLIKAESGSILYEGENFMEMDFDAKKETRKKIGMLFQGGALFDSMTVLQNVMFPLDMFTNKTTEEKRDRADFCLQRVNLPNAHKLFPAEISGGMKKRVAIARAIAMNPHFLFCDEPNSGLDPRTSILIDNLISDITEEFNITTIVITHDMNSVMEIGDHIGFIYKGRMLWQGSKAEITKTTLKELNDFVYASVMMKRFREQMS